MWTWRQLLWLLPLASLGPALLEASPWGPARDVAAALRLFLVTLPGSLILVVVLVGPGIYLASRFRRDPWWVLPWTAIGLSLLVGAVSHWPPSRWWPLIFTGGIPTPTGYLLSYPLEAWHGYLYSLHPTVVRAFAAALSFLLAQSLVRPNKSLDRTLDA